MNSRIKIMLKMIGVLTLGALLTACQDTIPQRSTISPNSIVNGAPCPAGQVRSDLDDPESACVDAPPAARPTGAIKFKPDFCACKDGKAVSLGNCSSFCATKNTNGAEILYASFNVTEAIALSGLGNVFAWCKKPLAGEQSNPVCALEAKDEDNNITELPVTNILNSNSITVDVKTGLDYDKTYVLTLVETISKARSDSVQLIKYTEEIPMSTLGPLKNAPISQYTCLWRDFSTDDNGNIYYDQAYRLHFYFLPRMEPQAIPAGISNLICHDINLLGPVDSAAFDRLEEIPGVFNLWDSQDPRFFNVNGDPQNIMDVNEIIAQKTRNFGGNIPSGTNFFAPFAWPGAPNLSEEAGNDTTTQTLGFYMAPWIETGTNSPKSYCLTSTHYNSSNALFKAMRDIIGVDTEGLYIGEKAAETVIVDGQPTLGFKDYILIREADLKAVWFYMNGSTPTAPTETNVADKTVYFYYPLNKTTPYVRSSTQRMFRLRGANELGTGPSGGTVSNGTTTTLPPHDRKIGCVPKF